MSVVELSHHDGRVTDAVSDDDREWFQRHHRATVRHRPYVPGEFPASVSGPVPAPPPGFELYVEVRQVAQGVRLRAPAYSLRRAA